VLSDGEAADAGAYAMLRQTPFVPVSQLLMCSLQRTEDCTRDREGVLPVHPSDRIHELAGVLVAAFTRRLDQDVKFILLLVRALTWIGAEETALFLRLTLDDGEPADPGFDRHLAT
jgi:hypothetical protein